MEKRHHLVIEHVDNGFVIRFAGRTLIAQDRNAVAGLLGHLFVVELMQAGNDMWKYGVTQE